MTTNNPSSAHHSNAAPTGYTAEGRSRLVLAPAWQRDESCFQDNGIHRLCGGGYRRTVCVLPRQYH